MRLLALILVASHAALGCTVVVDARPKNPKPNDTIVSDASVSDIENLDALADIIEPDGADGQVSGDVSAIDVDGAPLPDTVEDTDGLGQWDTEETDSGDVAPPLPDVIEDVEPEPEIITTDNYLLDTADDLLMNDGITGTLVLKKEHAVVFPLDLSASQKNILALTPDTILEKSLEFSCLGNSNVEGFFFDSTQKGPGATLKLLPENPIAIKLTEGSAVSTKGSATVVSVELELPFTVPQNEFNYEPDTLCYGVFTQGDWYFSFDPVQVQLDPLAKKGTGVLEIEFPAGVEAVAILTGQNIAINWIRYTVSD